MFLAYLWGVQLTFNLYTAITLWAAGAVAGAAWLRADPRRWHSTYWVFAAIGLGYLGFDEHLSLHERMGRRLTAAGVDVPGVHDIDGLVLIAFAAIAIVVSAIFRREVLARREVVAALLAGAALTVLAFALDDFGANKGVTGWLEERAEWAGSASYLAACALRLRAGAGSSGSGWRAGA